MNALQAGCTPALHAGCTSVLQVVLQRCIKKLNQIYELNLISVLNESNSWTKQSYNVVRLAQLSPSLFFSIYQVRCVLCSFISECKGNTKKHVVKDHKNWKEEISNMNKNKPKQTIHNHQNWRAELIRNFKDLIIGKCSVKVQNAVRSNEDIQVIWSVECCYFQILYYRMVVIMMRSLTKFWIV